MDKKVEDTKALDFTRKTGISMICRFCGNVIDDNTSVCPYCGSAVQSYTEEESYDSAPAYDDTPAYDAGAAYDDSAYEDDGQDYSAPAPKKKLGGGFKMPNLPMSTIISIASAIFSFLCLLTVSSIKSSISDSTNTILTGVNQIQSSVTQIDDKIGGLDSTVANVQQQAYNQLASQTITIDKNITSLTGPVALNRYNQMFIVKAKGSLNLNTSFTWQKYNEATGGWTDIVFTGSATTNDEYGLRLENKMEDGLYVSVLWANGITKAAEGTYRCVITDTNGITKTSAEATVQVSDTPAT